MDYIPIIIFIIGIILIIVGYNEKPIGQQFMDYKYRISGIVFISVGIVSYIGYNNYRRERTKK